MKILEGLRERYRSELIRRINEKFGILFDRHQIISCDELCLEDGQTISNVYKCECEFIINVQDYFSNTSLSELSTTLLESLAFNNWIKFTHPKTRMCIEV